MFEASRLIEDLRIELCFPFCSDSAEQLLEDEERCARDPRVSSPIFFLCFFGRPKSEIFSPQNGIEHNGIKKRRILTTQI